MNTRQNISATLFMMLALAGTTCTCAIAKERDKNASDEIKPRGGSISHTVNTEEDRDRSNRKPDRVIDDKPFNPWGDDRYDKKPQSKNGNSNVKPGIVISGSGDRYSGLPYKDSGDRKDVREKRGNRENQKYVRDRYSRDSQSYYKDDPKKIKNSYVPQTNREGHYQYSSRPNFKPSRYGFWGFDNRDSDYCTSVYFNYGYYPYVNRARIRIAPYITADCFSKNIAVSNDDYYLANRNKSEIGIALSDIRMSWLDGRSNLIDNHVRNDQMIAVILDGKYDYSIEADDYIQMTYDAIDVTQTIKFTWERVRQRTDGAYTAFGKHTYRDSYGNEQTVYVSYTLKNIGSEYIIVEVGSSKRYFD